MTPIHINWCSDYLVHLIAKKEVDQENVLLKEKVITECHVSDFYLLVFDTYAASLLEFIGILLNMLACWQLLGSSERKKILDLMLVAILLFDSFCLTFKLMRSLELYGLVPDEDLLMFYTIANSGVKFSLTSSILMMVAIGRVRYQAARKPIDQKSETSSRRKGIREFLKYLIPTLILSSAFTTPILFEIDNTLNKLEGVKRIELSPSNTRLSPFYSFFILGILNLGLLGALPLSCLIYFAHKIIVCAYKRRVQKSYPLNVVGMINDERESNVSKSLVVIIFVLITLHSLRIIISIGELYVATMSNKNEVSLELSYGVPMWLQIVAPVSELCTILNACVNTIIYHYLTSSAILNYRPTSIPSCLRKIASVETPFVLLIRRRNTSTDIRYLHSINDYPPSEEFSLTSTAGPVYFATDEKGSQNISKEDML